MEPLFHNPLLMLGLSKVIISTYPKFKVIEREGCPCLCLVIMYIYQIKIISTIASLLLLTSAYCESQFRVITRTLFDH